MTVGRYTDQVKPNDEKQMNLRVMRDPPARLSVSRTVTDSPYAGDGPGPQMLGRCLPADRSH